MRVLNKHSAPVNGLAPGEIGDVDESIPGISVFVDAGWLVDVDTIREPAREPSTDEMRAEIERLRGQCEALRAHVDDANANALKFGRETQEARTRVAELEEQNKHLSAVSETNAGELGKAHEANRKLAARVAELESQLAAKSEPAPVEAPATEAPAKKGKG